MIFAKVRSNSDRFNFDREWIWAVAIFLAAVFLFCFNLGNLPLRDWDEGTIAQVAREIWRSPPASLTWLYPTLGEQPYLNKPPLIHTLIGISYSLFGISEWSTRLPTAILAATSLPLLYLVSRELFADRRTAIFSTFVYLTLLPVARHSRLAMLDGALISFFLLFLLSILRLNRDRLAFVGISIGLTLICLTKGIMMGLLLAAIAILFLGIDRPKLLTHRLFCLAVAMGITPVLLWYLAQYLHYGEKFFSVNLVDQTFSRVWTTVEQQTGAPWYYLLEIVKYAFPWLIFAPPGFKLAWHERHSSWAKLVLVWSSIYLLAISVMTTKLPWYVLPLYPAFAIAIGNYLDRVWSKFKRGQGTGNGEQRGREAERQRSREQIQSLSKNETSVLLVDNYDLRLILLILLSIIGGIASIYFGFFSSSSELDLQLISVAITITMISSSICLNKRNPYFIVAFVVGLYLALLLFFNSNNWVWELAESYPVKPVAEIIKQNTLPGQVIYTSYAYNRPSLDFYSDRQVIAIPKEEIKKFWLKEKYIYLLIESNLSQELNLNNIKIIDKIEEWHLITKNN